MPSLPQHAHFALIIFSKHSSSSSQLGRDMRQKQDNHFSRRFIMLVVARADRHVMQGEQSAGTGQKNTSQNGRAQNIHCDNVTPLGLGNWRALVSAARKPRAGRASGSALPAPASELCQQEGVRLSLLPEPTFNAFIPELHVIRNKRRLLP